MQRLFMYLTGMKTLEVDSQRETRPVIDSIVVQ